MTFPGFLELLKILMTYTQQNGYCIDLNHENCFPFSVEAIQSNPHFFNEGLNVPNATFSTMRRLSDISIQSTMSGMIDAVPLQAVSARKYQNRTQKYLNPGSKM